MVVCKKALSGVAEWWAGGLVGHRRMSENLSHWPLLSPLPHLLTWSFASLISFFLSLSVFATEEVEICSERIPSDRGSPTATVSLLVQDSLLLKCRDGLKVTRKCAESFWLDWRLVGLLRGRDGSFRWPSSPATLEQWSWVSPGGSPPHVALIVPPHFFCTCCSCEDLVSRLDHVCGSWCAAPT